MISSADKLIQSVEHSIKEDTQEQKAKNSKKSNARRAFLPALARWLRANLGLFALGAGLTSMALVARIPFLLRLVCIWYMRGRDAEENESDEEPSATAPVAPAQPIPQAQPTQAPIAAPAQPDIGPTGKKEKAE